MLAGVASQDVSEVGKHYRRGEWAEAASDTGHIRGIALGVLGSADDEGRDRYLPVSRLHVNGQHLSECLCSDTSASAAKRTLR